MLALLAGASAARAADVTVSGSVLDDAGSPLVGAGVVVRDAATETEVASTVTLALGAFQLTLAPATYDVTITPPEGSGLHATEIVGRTVTADVDLGTIQLRSGPDLQLSGTLTFPDGKPLVACKVDLLASLSVTPLTTTTDASGHYAFAVSPDSYYLRIWDGNPHDGYHSSVTRGPALIDADTVLDLTMPFKLLTVRVLDEHGSALPGASVDTSSVTLNGGLPVPG